MSLIFEKDVWLSEVMERLVFRWIGKTVPGERALLQDEMIRLAGKDGGFFFMKSPSLDVAQLSFLTRSGFNVVDTAVSLEWSEKILDSEKIVEVVLARSEHYPGLSQIGETSFRYSRFHLDPHIPRELANKIKRLWLENYFSGKRGAALYVAILDGKPVGFLAVILSDNKAIIDLIGIDQDYQGQGIGGALIRFFIQEWGKKVPSLQVGTQAANIPSLRLYEKNGFRTFATQYVLHAHMLPGGIFL